MQNFESEMTFSSVPSIYPTVWKSKEIHLYSIQGLMQRMKNALVEEMETIAIARDVKQIHKILIIKGQAGIRNDMNKDFLKTANPKICY